MNNWDEKLKIITEELDYSEREKNPILKDAMYISTLRMLVQLGKEAQSVLAALPTEAPTTLPERY